MYDPNGIPIYEAIFNVPVVCSDICGLKNQVNKCGITFNPNSEIDLSNKIKLMWSNTDLYESCKSETYNQSEYLNISEYEKNGRNFLKRFLKYEIHNQ